MFGCLGYVGDKGGQERKRERMAKLESPIVFFNHCDCTDVFFVLLNALTKVIE